MLLVLYITTRPKGLELVPKGIVHKPIGSHGSHRWRQARLVNQTGDGGYVTNTHRIIWSKKPVQMPATVPQRSGLDCQSKDSLGLANLHHYMITPSWLISSLCWCLMVLRHPKLSPNLGQLCLLQRLWMLG